MAPLAGRTVEMLEMRAPRGLGMDHSRRTCNYVRGPFFLPLAIKHPNLVACMISDRSIQIATLVEDLERRKKKNLSCPSSSRCSAPSFGKIPDKYNPPLNSSRVFGITHVSYRCMILTVNLYRIPRSSFDITQRHE